MQRKGLPGSEKYIKTNKRRRVWHKLVRVMSGVVVFCTTYSLILPAITMENPTTCEKEEHTHSEICYIRAMDSMDPSAHEHDELCYQIPEDAGHVHTDEDCYTPVKGDLICQEAEAHFHTDTCQGGKNLICALEENTGHAHGEECYASTLTCTEVTEIAHEHGDACYVNTEVCTPAEGEEHTHDDSCYASTLNCEKTVDVVHTHDENCYTKEQTCTLAEGDGAHTHGSECYEEIPACTLTEGEGHVHEDACYDWDSVLSCTEEQAEPVLVCTESTEESEETTEAAEEELTCTLAEDETHTHNFLCYGQWELICPMEEHTHSLICFTDPTADVETEEVWLRTLPDELTGVYVDDLLAAAESQLDYTESVNNYTVLEDGVTMKGYTRYGAWYGDPYGDWDGMFASFCLYYAGANELEALKDFPLEADPAEWVEKLEELEELDETGETQFYAEAADVTPEPGDLVFFNNIEDEYNEADHVGIVIEIIEEENETPKLHIYEGDVEDQVQHNKYELDDPAILGYGLLPEVPDYEPISTTETTAATEATEATEAVEIPSNIYSYSDETLYVEVELPEDTTVPADAVLTVTPIASDNADYEGYVAQAQESVDGEVVNIALYDISFYTADDNTYIPVSDTAKVTMGFTESPVDTDAQIQVLHFEQKDTLPQIIEDFSFGEKEIDMILADVQKALEEPTAALLEQAAQISQYPGAVEEVEGDAGNLVKDVLGNIATAFSLTPAEEPTAETESTEETTSATESTEETQAAEVPEEAPAVEIVTENRTVIEFQTPGFSTFAVVQVDGGTYSTTKLTDAVLGTNGLDGKKIVISTGFVQDDKRYALTSEEVAVNALYNGEYHPHNRLKAAVVTTEDDNTTVVTTPANKNLLWEFEYADAANTYYIKSVTTGEYLSIDQNRTLTTTETQNAIVIEEYNDTGYKFTLRQARGDANSYLRRNGTEETTQEDIEVFNTWDNSNYSEMFLSEYEENPIPVGEATVETRILGSKETVGENNENTTALNGKVLFISTADEYEEGTWHALSSEAANNGTRLGAVNAVRDGNATVSVPSASAEQLEWKFTADGTTGKYFIRSVATDEYLILDDDGNVLITGEDTTESYYVIKAPGYNISWLISRSNIPDGNAAGDYTNGRELAYADEGYFQTANNPGNNDFNGDGKARYRGCLILSEVSSSVETTKVENPVAATGHPLDGNVLAINNVYTATDNNGTTGTRSVLTTNVGNRLQTATALVGDNTYEVSPTALWKFEAATEDNAYYIRTYDYATGQAGNYVHVDSNNITLVEKANATVITVATDGDYVNLKPGNRFIAYNYDEDNITAYNNAAAQDNFILTEYDAEPDVDRVRVTGLGDKVFFVVGVDNDGDGTLPALSSSVTADKTGLTGQNINAGIINTGYNAGVEDVIDDGNDLGWAFKETNTPGVYNIMVVNGDNGVDLGNHLIADEETTYKYLNINADGTLTVSGTKQNIEVVEAPSGNSNVDTVALRAEIDGKYYYVNLPNNSRNADFISSASVNPTDASTHLALVEMKSVNNVVDMINQLLFGDGDPYTESDNMEFVADEGYKYTDENGDEHEFFGSFKFGDDAGDIALTGTATDKNGNQNQKGDNFQDNYDAAVAYREKQQELAKAAKAAYDALPEEEKKYVYNAEELLALKWLWTELPIVQPATPQATVKLFNYSDGTVAGQQDINSYLLAKNYGFNFYHKNTYDEYTAENVTTRENSEKFGNNDTALQFYPALIDGVPVVTAGQNGNTMQSVGTVEGSLDYLFSENVDGAKNPNYVTTMEEGGGLFQYNPETGYYYYHANQNAAHWDEETNKFVLYDAVIRPMYVPAGANGEAVGANNNEDRYNFLPFDDPANTAIVDKDPMHVEWQYANGDDMEWDKTSAYLNERPDMWFGMTIDTNFFMPANGEVLNPQGELQDMIFKFHGDDDTLIYINGILVVDIGGVHGAEDGWINFSTGMVYYEDGARGATEENIKDLIMANMRRIPEFNTYTDDEILSLLKSDYGIEFETTKEGYTTLKQYTTYTMDFFYMERGGNVSYCGIEYNLVEIPENSLSIYKEVDADIDNDGDDDAINTNLTYTYRVLQVVNGSVTDKNFFAVNTPYDIIENGVTVGTGYVDANGLITLKEGQRAEFKNIVDPYKGGTVPDYVVQEILPNGEAGQYTVWYTCVGGEKTQITNPITGKITDHTIFQTAPIRTSDNLAEVVNFTNEVEEPTGSLAIQKRLANNAASEESFTFKIETGGISAARAMAGNNTAEYSIIGKGTRYKLYTVSTDENGKEVLTLVTRTITVNGVETTVDYHEVTSNDGTITLKPNQRAVFDGILAGTHFKISEVLASDQHYAATYHGEILNKDTIEETTIVYYDASGAYGTFTQDDADVLVTVTNNDSLTNVSFPLSKTIPNYVGADSFEIDTTRLSSVEISGNTLTYSNQTGADGEDNTQDAANPTITVNSDGTSSGTAVFNFVLADVDGDDNEYQYYFRLTEKADNSKSYIYDKTIYVAEVTLTKGTDADGKTIYTGAVTRVWKNDGTSTGNTVTCTLVENADSLDFVNYRYTQVSVQKIVDGVPEAETNAGKFDFEATVTADVGTQKDQPFDLTQIPANTAEGSGITVDGTQTNKATFSIVHGNTQILYVPYGATVNVKETSGTGYYTSYQVGNGRLTTGKETDDFTVTDPILVVFNNEKTTSVTVKKTVENGTATSGFTFSATITYPDGTKHSVENFELDSGEEKVIDNIPVGSTIQVQELDGAGYITSYNVSAKIEAENGTATGSTAFMPVSGASSGYQLNNLGNNGSTVTFNPSFRNAGTYDLDLIYNQDATRSFEVAVNSGEAMTLEGVDTGGWDDGSFETLTTPITMVYGANSITVGGVGRFAPNLDYVVLTGPEVNITDNRTVTEYVNGETTIHFVNEVGYELPNSGGPGTYLYTIGGLMLTLAAAILLYSKSKRGKEDFASS